MPASRIASHEARESLPREKPSKTGFPSAAICARISADGAIPSMVIGTTTPGPCGNPVSTWQLGYHRGVSNPIEENAAELERVLEQIEQAAEQAAGWLAERDRLVVQAKALGGSHRQIGSRADLSHAG